uniref:Glycosyltransferase n=1 Tax=viral metagenome TaxID=1070528 RepID=A0A6C0HKJ4_9ZZZZ
MTTPSFGAYFQCYKNPYATYMVLESFRRHYPSSTVVLCSDNGYDYTKMAEHFNCIYHHRTKNMWLIYGDCVELDKGKDGAHIPWAKELLSHMKSMFSLIKEDYILWLEDDLSINHPISDSCINDINGFNPNHYWENMKVQLSKTYTHIHPSKDYTWSGGGGSIFNKSSILRYLDNEIIIDDLLMNWSSYNLTREIVCDFLLSIIVHCNCGTVGSLHAVEDGPRNEIVSSLAIQHQYKRYYGVPMPHELYYLIKE